jgi:hypothetical protein
LHHAHAPRPPSCLPYFTSPPTAIQSRLDKEVALHIGPNRTAVNAADEQAAVDAMLRPTLTASIEKGGAVAPL